MRRWAFTGVMLFVMFPLTGTGAIGGSLFGRLLGLSRIRTFLSITVGSAIGCFGMAALAEVVANVIPEEVRNSLWFEMTGIALIVFLVLFLMLRSRRNESRTTGDIPKQKE
jgi:uncharacterized membrane protein